MKGIPASELEIIEDGGYSGSNLNRPNLAKLLTAVNNDEIQTIIIFKLDRITRSIGDFAKLLKNFSEKDVQLISINEGLDLSSLTGKLVAQILIIFAEFELEQDSLRTKEALRNKALQGFYPFGGNPPLGYKRDNSNKKNLMIDSDMKPLYDFIVDTFLTVQNITMTWELYMIKYGTIHPLQKEAIFKILTNPVYISKVNFQSQSYQLKHPPLITEEVYNLILSILKATAKVTTHSYFFNGMLKCNKCNNTLYNHVAYNHQGKAYQYYQCKTCKYMISQTKLYDELNTVILNIIKTNPNENELVTLKEKLSFLTNLSKQYKQQYINDEITIDQLQKAEDKIKKDIKKIKKQISLQNRANDKLTKLANDPAYINYLLRGKIEHIYVSKDKNKCVKRIEYKKKKC